MQNSSDVTCNRQITEPEFFLFQFPMLSFPALSEQGMLAVNGMSYQARDSKNANSALIVTVTPEDFPEEGPLGGISFQRELEKRAWEIGKGKIPVQLFGDYKLHQKSSAFGEIEPQMKGAHVFADVRSILPKEIGDSIDCQHSLFRGCVNQITARTHAE